jgi:hypothetical protein
MFQMLHLRRKCPSPKGHASRDFLYLKLPPTWELSLDDWLKLLATQTCKIRIIGCTRRLINISLSGVHW